MTAIVGLHLRGSEDRRNAKKRKRFHSRNKPKESLSRRLAVKFHWCLTFFLLFFLPAAAGSLLMEGRKGDSITLPCSLSNREDLSTVLIFGPKIAYGWDQDEHFRGRVKESGSCDFILQDLKTTDAGKYISKVYANGQQLNSYTYDIHINVSLTGWKGKELMFDELPREAKNVTHLTKAGWTEVWRSGQGDLTDRLTIKNFSSSDAGIYRVLNSSGGILVTVTVTESGTESKDKHKDEPRNTERVPVWVWIGIGVVVALVALIALIAFAVNKIRQHLNKKHDSYQGVPMQETELAPRLTNNS